MEVFLARSKKTETNEPKEEPEVSIVAPVQKDEPPEKLPVVMPPPPTNNNVGVLNNATIIHKGPSEQIETRTADGRRRITPKFSPHPVEVNAIYVL